MGSRLTITIKKRSATGWLVWLLIMMPFFLAFLNEFLGVSNAVRYLMDVAWGGLLLLMVLNKRSLPGAVGGLALWVILFFLYTLMVYIAQYQSALYYLWGFRNNFRFYIAFFLFVRFLKQREGEDYLKLFDGIFWLNAVVSVFQFFVLDLQGDHLGGIFFTEAGGNGYTNIFFLIVITRSVVLYLEKREPVGLCAAKLMTAVAVAAMAELKFFFAELILVIVLASLFSRFSWRKLWIILGGFLVVLVGAVALARLYPYFSEFFSYRWFLNEAMSAKGYTYDGDLNRLNAIPMINELWLKNRGQRFFGLGLGNCDTSGFAFLNTPFFRIYGDLHYNWMSYAMMYLECGYAGLVFYWGFFVLVYFKIRKMERHAEGEMISCCRFARILAILCVVISVYNGSLRMEAGYMAYFVLAIPFAYHRQLRYRK